MTTLGELKERIKDLPDDYEIWIEYPERYGFHSPFEMDTICNGEHDCIRVISIAKNHKKKRIYLLHHF